ncbi:MAG: hypothetical protein KDC49_08245 [Saprospiraceae bacterium]|nr:hypothetical protein [Saprospiraceae bacterium]
MSRILLLAISVVFFASLSAQQVGIGTNNPNNSSVLELYSDSLGLLIPRMDSLHRTSIPNPAQGLLVFQNNGNKGFYYFDGSVWLKVGGDGNEWMKNVEADIYTLKDVGIGSDEISTSAALEISSTSKGFLMPRMTTIQRDAIASPVQGLKIFNTDDFCEDTFNGESWMKNCSQIMVSDSLRPGDTWQKLDSIPVSINRYGMITFTFGNKIITGMGFSGMSPQTGYFTDLWEYDVTTKIWTQKNNFPSNGRSRAFSCVVDGKGYIIGGASLATGEVWEYDPENDSWIQKSNFPGGTIEYQAGFVIGSKVYVGGGDGSLGYTNEFWEYNPASDSWLQLANVPGSVRNWPVGFAIGNKGYIGMGRGPTAGIYISDLYEYNPSDNTWQVKQSYPGGGGGPVVSFVINEEAYVGIGTLDGDIKPLFYKFDPDASGNQWAQLSDFPGVARTLPFQTVVYNKAYLGCGFLNSNFHLNDFWVYNPNPDKLQNYKQQVPADVNNLSNLQWTSESDARLYASNTSYKIGIGTKTPKIKLHVEANNDASLADNSGILMVGNLDGNNILLDNNEIMARNDGTVNQLILQNHGGDMQVGGNVGLGKSPEALLHLKAKDGTNNRHIKLESNSSSDNTKIYAGTNFIIENSSASGDFYFRNGTTNINVLSVTPAGNLSITGDLEADGSVKGALKYNEYSSNMTSSGSTQTFTVGNRTYIKATCTSGSCTSCSGSGCPDLILTDGEADGHILVLRGNADSNRGLYMPGNLAGTTNYRLTANFQLAANNVITLIWMSDLSEWREVSRAVY